MEDGIPVGFKVQGFRSRDLGLRGSAQSPSR